MKRSFNKEVPCRVGPRKTHKREDIAPVVTVTLEDESCDKELEGNKLFSKEASPASSLDTVETIVESAPDNEVAPAESSNVSAFDVTKENKSVFVVRPTCKLNYGIYQPSTSKAVWNNSSGVYEEGFTPVRDELDAAADNVAVATATEVAADIKQGVSNTEPDSVDVDDGMIDNDYKGFKLQYSDSGDFVVHNVDDDFQPQGKDVDTEKISKPTIKLEVIDLMIDEKTEPIIKHEADNKLLNPLMEMFPQASPDYLKELCDGKTFTEELFDELVTKLLTEGCPEREKISDAPFEKAGAEKRYEMIKEILPDADPIYLQYHCDNLSDDLEQLMAFISNALETRNYPTMKDYLRAQQVSAQKKQYTNEFEVSKFLEVIPDPLAVFMDPSKRSYGAEVVYASLFLKNQYNRVPVIAIDNILKETGGLVKAAAELDLRLNNNDIPFMKAKRKSKALPATLQNIPLLQEMAFLTHKKEILQHIKDLKVQKEIEKQVAKEKGQLLTCNCCFDDEVLESNSEMCEKGCIFCKECIQKSVEVTFGQGKLEFLCLSNCKAQFSLQALQAALNPKLFSKVAQKKQLEEVKAAGIEDLEMCPFCDFATIPAEGDKIFRCLNPDCMKESCRSCKEPSHIPLKCEEVEKDEDVKKRTYIENKMTEALIKKCKKCGKGFIKSTGCNKITCTCGFSMCYICGEPVSDYRHFNGQGGDQHHLCPLYSDTVALEEQAVLNEAQRAKAELGVSSDGLKFDPAADIKKHYKKLKKNSYDPVLPMYQRFQDLPAFFEALRAYRERMMFGRAQVNRGRARR